LTLRAATERIGELTPPEQDTLLSSEDHIGPVAVDPLAVSRCLAAVATVGFTTHRPLDLLQTP
jgi:hypothetical protein